jgi:hypothetical protein
MSGWHFARLAPCQTGILSDNHCDKLGTASDWHYVKLGTASDCYCDRLSPLQTVQSDLPQLFPEMTAGTIKDQYTDSLLHQQPLCQSDNLPQ